MIVYQTNADGTLVGVIELNNTDKCPITGAWLIPGGCVEVAPPDERLGFNRVWQNGTWQYVEIPVEPEPEPTEPEIVTPPVDQNIADLWQAMLAMSAEIETLKGGN